MSEKIRCEQCNQDVTIEREGQFNLLHASCGCNARYVKVEQALPERWSV